MAQPVEHPTIVDERTAQGRRAAHHVEDEVPGFTPSPLVKWRWESHLVLPFQNHRRNRLGEGVAKNSFHPTAFELDIAGDRCGEFYQRMVEKRKARLEAMSHAH